MVALEQRTAALGADSPGVVARVSGGSNLHEFTAVIWLTPPGTVHVESPGPNVSLRGPGGVAARRASTVVSHAGNSGSPTVLSYDASATEHAYGESGVGIRTERLMSQIGGTTEDPHRGELVGERGAAEAPKVVSYETWSRRDAVQAFAGLPVPDPAEVQGRWDGEFVGRPVLARLSRSMFHGWCGKEITDPEHGHNLIRRHGHVKAALKLKISPGVSRFDGQPAIVVSYAETDPAPARVLRGELRWLSPGAELLGLLMIQIGRHVIGPFPFSLRRFPH